ncbi:MAG: toxic anion resistance protein [Candidatus Dormibacteraeota bacterium]|nr:toxic anion resistance protein [Candidatus Dormibacteraeota bacterium]
MESLADRELRSAGVRGRGLATIAGRGADVLDERNGSIARSLEDLRRWARELTPRDELGSGPPARRLGIFARGDRARSYEKRWARAQQPIEAIVARLRQAVARLRADNAALAEEQLALDTQIGALTSYSQLSRQLDERLTSHLDALGKADPTRADILRRELLLEVRRRRGEILTQLTVAIQGRAAMRIIEENNRELIDAVASATTGTIGVLQTAALVRQALNMRRHLQAGLRQGDLANRDVGGQVPEAETLQRAWTDVGETLNQVERLRRQLTESAAMLTRSDLG